jgi:Na+-transporting NADH:ubiquinone oxidoreductase subunit NqrD
MRDTNRSMIRKYIVGGVWLIVMLATIAVLFAPLDTLYVAVDADPVVRTATTMTIAILAATVAAALAWSLMRPRSETALATFR